MPLGLGRESALPRAGEEPSVDRPPPCLHCGPSECHQHPTAPRAPDGLAREGPLEVPPASPQNAEQS